MKRVERGLLVLILGVLAAGCGGPNCFAGECATGIDPDLDEEQAYFLEIAFGAERGGYEELLRRVEAGLRVRLRDHYTGLDSLEVLEVLSAMAALSGQSVELVPADADVDVHFMPGEEFPSVIPSASPTADGTASIPGWGPITGATVLISTDSESGSPIRNHAIWEELTQIFGIMKDSYRHPESLFYEGHSSLADHAEIDEFVIRTLYDPRLEVGMADHEARRALGW